MAFAGMHLLRRKEICDRVSFQVQQFEILKALSIAAYYISKLVRALYSPARTAKN